jgi:hypothetical protein
MNVDADMRGDALKFWVLGPNEVIASCQGTDPLGKIEQAG